MPLRINFFDIDEYQMTTMLSMTHARMADLVYLTFERGRTNALNIVNVLGCLYTNVKCRHVDII